MLVPPIRALCHNVQTKPTNMLTRRPAHTPWPRDATTIHNLYFLIMFNKLAKLRICVSWVHFAKNTRLEKHTLVHGHSVRVHRRWQNGNVKGSMTDGRTYLASSYASKNSNSNNNNQAKAIHVKPSESRVYTFYPQTSPCSLTTCYSHSFVINITLCCHS